MQPTGTVHDFARSLARTTDIGVLFTRTGPKLHNSRIVLWCIPLIDSTSSSLYAYLTIKDRNINIIFGSSQISLGNPGIGATNRTDI